MSKSRPAIDIFLQPGELYFGDRTTRIRTLLGSCVSVTLWHPQRQLGGMCHFMLPRRERSRGSATLDGRYADEALALLIQAIPAPSQLHEYEAKLFGGGHMFSELPGPDRLNIPQRNIDAGKRILAHYGIELKAAHTGGQGYRQLIFDVATGDVWLRQVSPPRSP